MLWLVVSWVILRISLLKFILVSWILDAVSMSCVSQVMVVLGADVVRFGAHNGAFGMPAASNLAPWGIIERSRGILEAQKGRRRDFCRFGMDFGTASCKFSVNFGASCFRATYLRFVMFVSRSLFNDLGVLICTSEALQSSIWREVLQNQLIMFFDGLGFSLSDFWLLGVRLEI